MEGVTEYDPTPELPVREGGYDLSGFRVDDHVHASHVRVWHGADPLDRDAEPLDGPQPGDMWLNGSQVKILNGEWSWVAV